LQSSQNNFMPVFSPQGKSEIILRRFSPCRGAGGGEITLGRYLHQPWKWQMKDFLKNWIYL
jgi:hypothetical protein